MKLLFALFPLFVWGLPNSVAAQVRDGISTGKDAVYGEDGVDVLYSHTSGIHLIAHSQGAGIGAHYGWFLNAKTSRSINADLVYFKHEKEEKTSNPVYNDGLPYVFGKLNSFLVFRINIETRKELTPKLRQGAVRVERVFRYGIGLGLEKPVYLEIGYPEIPYDYLATELYNPDEHFYNDIYGRSPWVNGLDEMNVIPGGNLNYALSFEYGDVRGMTRHVEMGTSLDVFVRPVEIMAVQFVESQLFFLSLYLKIGLGANWTQK
tara:strand:+ start:3038 stop:3826 length:789 start_codon:yes stop_codon:yes gene_type:complete